MNKQEENIERYHQLRAKEIVDILFDGKCFRSELTRDQIQSIEDLIAYNFQSYAKSARRTAEIMATINKK